MRSCSIRRHCRIRAPFVARSAGSALKQLVQDLLPGRFDTSGVQDLDVIAAYPVNPQKTVFRTCAEISFADARLLSRDEWRLEVESGGRDHLRDSRSGSEFLAGRT